MYDHQHHISQTPTHQQRCCIHKNLLLRSGVELASKRRAGVEASRRRGLMLLSIASAFLASRCRGGIEVASRLYMSVELAWSWRGAGVELASRLCASRRHRSAITCAITLLSHFAWRRLGAHSQRYHLRYHLRYHFTYNSRHSQQPHHFHSEGLCPFLPHTCSCDG